MSNNVRQGKGKGQKTNKSCSWFIWPGQTWNNCLIHSFPPYLNHKIPPASRPLVALSPGHRQEQRESMLDRWLCEVPLKMEHAPNSASIITTTLVLISLSLGSLLQKSSLTTPTFPEAPPPDLGVTQQRPWKRVHSGTSRIII